MSEPATDQPPTEPVARDYESDAAKMGWVPADQFRGDPEKHIEAEEFVKRGEKRVPLLIANQKKLTDRIGELENSIKFQSDLHQKNLKDQNTRLRKELSEEMQDAAREGDEERHAAAMKKRDDIQDPEPPKPVDRVPDEVVRFEADNTWYGTDNAMTVVAQAESKRLFEEKPELTLDQNLKATGQYVKEQFPHKFGNPRRDEPAAVGGGKKPGKGSAKTFGNLPQDAKDAFKTFHRDGVFGKGASEVDAQKAYLSTYQWDD